MELIFGLAGLVLGMWAGDYLGRKYPTQWALLRLSLKRAGERSQDEAKE